MTRQEHMDAVESSLRDLFAAGIATEEHTQIMRINTAISHCRRGKICIADSIRKVLSEAEYSCTECGEAFVSQVALSGHMKKHAKKYQRSAVHVKQSQPNVDRDRSNAGKHPHTPPNTWV